MTGLNENIEVLHKYSKIKLFYNWLAIPGTLTDFGEIFQPHILFKFGTFSMYSFY